MPFFKWFIEVCLRWSVSPSSSFITLVSFTKLKKQMKDTACVMSVDRSEKADADVLNDVDADH